ncbi:unnamed protein product [Fraxinus pennsylvanica]|uniref:GOLD domain-containing protein n=1 Tax=Fraxinus pennsylvanica TaxID=56036 RepID=A0AAD1ZRD5_9LAMI|nr:unnamed protein product [Fraxinus pennsylvanica]
MESRNARSILDLIFNKAKVSSRGHRLTGEFRSKSSPPSPLTPSFLCSTVAPRADAPPLIQLSSTPSTPKFPQKIELSDMTSLHLVNPSLQRKIRGCAPDHWRALMEAIEFEWKSSIAAKDWSNVAKKGQIEVIKLELKKLFDTITSFHDEMFYLHEREVEKQALDNLFQDGHLYFSYLPWFACLWLPSNYGI